MPAALEDRTFESAVPLSPEQEQSNRSHFEGKGYEIEVENEGAPVPVEEKQPEVVPPVEASPAATPPAEAAPAAVAPPADVDEETAAEWQTLKNDGEKLGRAARKTKRIKELEETKARQDGRIEELERQLDAQRKTPPASTASPITDPGLSTAPAVEPAKTEPAKPKEFDKARPVRPKFEDFRESEDPVAAFAEANAEFNESLINWNDEKRDFAAQQERAVQDSQLQVNAEHAKRVNTTVSKGKEAHADFVERTSAVKYTPVLQYLIHEILEDGPEIAYQLALPENKETYDRVFASTNTAPNEDASSINLKIHRANTALAEFRYGLKHKSTPAPPAGAPKPPANADPPVAATLPKQTPPAEPPRREEAAPAPVRGRSAPTIGIEDVDPMDSDERRRLKKERGLMR